MEVTKYMSKTDCDWLYTNILNIKEIEVSGDIRCVKFTFDVFISTGTRYKMHRDIYLTIMAGYTLKNYILDLMG